MATLNAIAARQDSTLFGILWPQPHQGKVVDQPAANIDICALVDSEGSPSKVADNVLGLVEEGFRAVKVKVRGGFMICSSDAYSEGKNMFLKVFGIDSFDANDL